MASDACIAQVDSKVSGVWVKDKCGKALVSGSRFCKEHQNRPKAIKEAEDKGIEEVVEAATEASDVIEAELEPQNTQDVVVKERYQPTSIFDKVTGVLNNALEFEEDARNAYQIQFQRRKDGDEDALRYTDKAGAEQTRSEVMVYERAMDRTIRAVTAVAKLNIDHQATQMNTVLKGLVKQTIIRVLQRLELSPEQIDLARRYISEEFQKLSDRANRKD